MALRYSIMIVAVLALALAIPAFVTAQGGRPGPGDRPEGMGEFGPPPCQGPFWTDERVAEQLGLSQEQIDSLNELDATHRQSAEQYGEQMRTLHEDLKEAIDSGDADTARALTQQMATLSAQSMADRTEFELGVRSILTDAQWEQLQSLRPQAPRGRIAHQAPRARFGGR